MSIITVRAAATASTTISAVATKPLVGTAVHPRCFWHGPRLAPSMTRLSPDRSARAITHTG
jgi:hypothetical protein